MTELLRQTDLERAAAPVQKRPAASPRDREERKPQEGIALCLSGGGYRAMLFHLGALWRLNETGHLHRLARVSSVSGGSIIAGVLALNWEQLAFDDAGVAADFDEQIVAPVRAMAGRTIDWQAILLGTLLPGSAGGRLAAAYRKHLFGATTLQQIPSHPEFVFNATNLQSGALWRFSKPYLWDYRVGEVKSPTARARRRRRRLVGVSAVPLTRRARPRRRSLRARLGRRARHERQPPAPAVHDARRARRRRRLRQPRARDGLEALHDRARLRRRRPHGRPAAARGTTGRMQAYRVLGVIDNQVRSLRKRQLIDGYHAGLREGTYWGIRSDIADYDLASSLPCPREATKALAGISTRLAALDPRAQERLINWGYAIADTAIRKWVAPDLQPPAGFPYPGVGVG